MKADYKRSIVSQKVLTTTIAKLSIRVHHISLLIRITESRVILHTLR